MKIGSYKDIDGYIKDQPREVQVLLKKVRAAVRKAAPKAEEAIRYGLPTLRQNGNLVHFGAFKNHVGFYPAPRAIAAFKKELSKYEGGKGTVQFPYDEPLPLALITRIVKYNVRELGKKAKKPKPSDGSSATYHADGSLWAKGRMKEGKMHGYWEWFRKDGTKMRSGHFKAGKQAGKWATYDKKGKVHKVTDIR